LLNLSIVTTLDATQALVQLWTINPWVYQGDNEGLNEDRRLIVNAAMSSSTWIKLLRQKEWELQARSRSHSIMKHEPM
ncbi:hypothetical protein GB937_007908, partial [Aspergillus fischeri]